MRLLAISDTYIPHQFMCQGLASLEPLGVQVEVRRWEHPTLVDLQEANLVVEKDGPGAVQLPQELLTNLDGFQILVVQFTPVPAAMIRAAKDLRVIAVARGGTENVDMEEANRRGISVLNTPGRNARAVAECALGLILGEIRNLARSHGLLKAGVWQRTFPNSDCIPELCDRTVGLVGYGAVAQLVAGYLKALGSRIVAADPFFRGDPGPAQIVSLETLLRESDVVSIHARLTAENYRMIGAKELALMKPTAVLVNTARSGLIDEPALVEALRQRRIMGAALDVFDTEPLPADHPLVKLDNVTITPHLAGSSVDAFRNSPKLVAGHLARLLRREAGLPVVNGIAPDYAGLLA